MAYSQKPVNKEIEAKLKFYSHYHWFLSVNALLMFFSLRSGMGFGWVPMFIIWGSIVIFHYLKVFKPELVEAWVEEGGPHYLESLKANEEFQLPKLKEIESNWRESDLV